MTSNPEMVSITRDQLRDLIAGYCGPNPLGDLYALADAPAEDVRAVVEEPVYRCHKCGCQTKPPAPYKLYVSCDCGSTTAATAALYRHPQREGDRE